MILTIVFILLMINTSHTKVSGVQVIDNNLNLAEKIPANIAKNSTFTKKRSKNIRRYRIKGHPKISISEILNRRTTPIPVTETTFSSSTTPRGSKVEFFIERANPIKDSEKAEIKMIQSQQTKADPTNWRAMLRNQLRT